MKTFFYQEPPLDKLPGSLAPKMQHWYSFDYASNVESTPMISFRPFTPDSECFQKTDQPTAKHFYAITNGSTFCIWQAQEEDSPTLSQTHPGFRIVQHFPSHEEAESFIRSFSGVK
jgi:hypothetical protein